MQGKLLVFAGLFALGLLALSQLRAPAVATHHTHFKNFVGRFGRQYASPSEVEFRSQVFARHLATIEAHNAKGKSFTMGVNQFTDLTYEEMFSFYVFQDALPNESFGLKSAISYDKGKKDWYSEKKVAEVKNQARCGSCWAFSAVGALESFYAIKNGVSADSITLLSEQELVDCSKKNHGCKGGLMNLAYDYVMANKLSSGEKYPYVGIQNACNDKKRDSIATLRKYEDLPAVDVNGLIATINRAPVAIAMEVNEDFFHYKSGIYVPN